MQNFTQFYKLFVVLVIVKPTFDSDAVARLHRKVLGEVVHNYRFRQIFAYLAQIFKVNTASEGTRVAVKSFADVFCRVNIVENPVGIVS